MTTESFPEVEIVNLISAKEQASACLRSATLLLELALDTPKPDL